MAFKGTGRALAIDDVKEHEAGRGAGPCGEFDRLGGCRKGVEIRKERRAQMTLLKAKELREALADFAREAIACADPDISQLGFERFRLHKGVPFGVSDAALIAQNRFVQLAMKRLGPTKGSAKIIDRALWDFIVTIQEKGTQLDTKNLNIALDEIEKNSFSVCEFFRPCPIIKMPDGIDRIEIGQVAIDRTESRIEDFRKVNKQFKFGVAQNWDLAIVMGHSDAGIVMTLPPTIWSINLAAADPVREEEGLWLADVALSIMRMCVKSDDLGVMAPRVGKVEPHPFFPHDRQDHSFALNMGGGGQLGAITAPNDYRLTQKGVDALCEPSVVSKIAQVFDARPKTVAERFYQGCGWLTRGRRSKDRSDRLLYFFTAIEALLSDSDKSSPIVQTISRNAAVLLSDDNLHRQKIAADIKQIYGVRSALVHAGARGAFDFDSNSAQRIAELLYLKVWHEIDISMSHQQFSSDLSKASFGMPFSQISNGSDSK